MVTVRPIVDRAGKVDVLGDAPVTAARSTSFDMRMQVTYSMRTLINGTPGQMRSTLIKAVMRNHDLPGGVSWTPTEGDIVELNNGDKVFVRDPQPDAPRSIRLGESRGGWDGWTFDLIHRDPQQRAAEQYP